LQGKFTATPSTVIKGAASSHSADIVNALLALGYNEKEADWASKQLSAEISVSDGIRQALKFLSKS
jgi:Holliday junction DNA helicase RuvA